MNLRVAGVAACLVHGIAVSSPSFSPPSGQGGAPHQLKLVGFSIKDVRSSLVKVPEFWDCDIAMTQMAPVSPSNPTWMLIPSGTPDKVLQGHDIAELGATIRHLRPNKTDRLFRPGILSQELERRWDTLSRLRGRLIRISTHGAIPPNEKDRILAPFYEEITKWTKDGWWKISVHSFFDHATLRALRAVGTPSSIDLAKRIEHEISIQIHPINPNRIALLASLSAITGSQHLAQALRSWDPPPPRILDIYDPQANDYGYLQLSQYPIQEGTVIADKLALLLMQVQPIKHWVKKQQRRPDGKGWEWVAVGQADRYLNGIRMLRDGALKACLEFYLATGQPSKVDHLLSGLRSEWYHPDNGPWLRKLAEGLGYKKPIEHWVHTLGASEQPLPTYHTLRYVTPKALEVNSTQAYPGTLCDLAGALGVSMTWSGWDHGSEELDPGESGAIYDMSQRPPRRLAWSPPMTRAGVKDWITAVDTGQLPSLTRELSTFLLNDPTDPRLLRELASRCIHEISILSYLSSERLLPSHKAQRQATLIWALDRLVDMPCTDFPLFSRELRHLLSKEETCRLRDRILIRIDQTYITQGMLSFLINMTPLEGDEHPLISMCLKYGVESELNDLYLRLLERGMHADLLGVLTEQSGLSPVHQAILAIAAFAEGRNAQGRQILDMPQVRKVWRSSIRDIQIIRSISPSAVIKRMDEYHNQTP